VFKTIIVIIKHHVLSTWKFANICLIIIYWREWEREREQRETGRERGKERGRERERGGRGRLSEKTFAKINFQWNENPLIFAPKIQQRSFLLNFSISFWFVMSSQSFSFGLLNFSHMIGSSWVTYWTFSHFFVLKVVLFVLNSGKFSGKIIKKFGEKTRSLPSVVRSKKCVHSSFILPPLVFLFHMFFFFSFIFIWYLCIFSPPLCFQLYPRAVLTKYQEGKWKQNTYLVL
jgi:hypothetical protein